MINGHGDDGYLFNNEIIADFSSNVCYDGVSPSLKQHLAHHLNHIHHYPEANAQSLQKALEQNHHLHPGQVLVTNGATEAFYLIAQAFRQHTATIIVPAFAEYEDACRVNELQIEYLPWEELTESSYLHTSLVFFGNPNNPTGLIKSKVLLHQLLQQNPETVFVIDEAYGDFTDADITMTEALSICNNLIIVKSLTKTYSIPGLRLGYMLSQSSIITKILAFKMPWSVNALAIAAGLYITKHVHSLKRPIHTLLEDTHMLRQQLSQINHITTYETHTNFFLCHTSQATAAELKTFLVQAYGILIRDASNFKRLSPQYFRIATQTPEKNKLLLKGISAWINLTA